jgi:hypothetical protein
MASTSEELKERLTAICPRGRVDLREWILSRVLRWRTEPRALFYQCRVGQQEEEEDDPPDIDLDVAAVLGDAFVLLRAAPDGCSETLIPLHAIDRIRFIQKEGKKELEIRHGECITWLVRLPEAQVVTDLEEFVVQVQWPWTEAKGR